MNRIAMILSSTADRLTQIIQAMPSLTSDIRQQTQTTDPPIVLPDLIPPAVIPPEEAWFWDENWLQGEREVNEELKAGSYETFETVDELLARLHQPA